MDKMPVGRSVMHNYWQTAWLPGTHKAAEDIEYLIGEEVRDLGTEGGGREMV